MLHGVINIYKEKGYTSHDVVAKMRRILKQKKIGHTGTLDPDAEGVLPVCLGKATRLCNMLTEKDKTYRAVLRLGVETDTQDITGRALRTNENAVYVYPEKDIVDTITSFTGIYSQVPPMYSALKVNGKKLYELAREGKVIEREPRQVYIHNIIIHKIELPLIELEVSCSKGTYIRTLCHDIGRKLGCGGCMDQLIRTQVGNFELEDSIKLGELEKKVKRVEDFIVPVDEMFRSYEKEMFPEEHTILLHNGNLIPEELLIRQYGEGQRLRVYDSEEQFVGIYEYLSEKHGLKLVKMFLEK